MSAGQKTNKLATVIKWFFLWLAGILGIVAAGAFAGSLLYPLSGLLFGYQLELNTIVLNGIKDGAFFAMIWAPGISFVICLIRIREKYTKNSDKKS